MSFLTAARSNDALNVNPTDANRSLSTNGSNWLWAVTAVFTLSLLSWLIWSFLLRDKTNDRHHTRNGNQPVLHGVARRDPERIFHYLFTIAAFAGLIAYFSMASDLGNAPVRQYMHQGTDTDPTRQIFYARYIYWFVAWPMIIIASLLLSGVSWATILFAIVIQEIWVVSWLCGAFVATSYKWGYYCFGIFAYLILAFVMLSWGRVHSRQLGSKHYTPLAALLVMVWTLYTIAWGLSEGSNYLSVTGEMIFYGILDLITVPLYGFLFLSLSRSWDYRSLDLQFTQNGRIVDTDGRSFSNRITTSVPVVNQNTV
jgi:bacteriorhodopsin